MTRDDWLDGNADYWRQLDEHEDSLERAARFEPAPPHIDACVECGVRLDFQDFPHDRCEECRPPQDTSRGGKDDRKVPPDFGTTKDDAPRRDVERSG